MLLVMLLTYTSSDRAHPPTPFFGGVVGWTYVGGIVGNEWSSGRPIDARLDRPCVWFDPRGLFWWPVRILSENRNARVT